MLSFKPSVLALTLSALLLPTSSFAAQVPDDVTLAKNKNWCVVTMQNRQR